jgi:hypothetical protein
MSNVNGNPISYPSNPNPGYYFRQGQAVQYVPNDPNATTTGTPDPTDVGAGTWTVDETNHLLTLVIQDDGALGNTFALAWAMTCGNDVIQGLMNLTLTSVITSPGGANSPVPLPGSAVLMATVLLGGSAFAKWNKKRRALS